MDIEENIAKRIDELTSTFTEARRSNWKHNTDAIAFCYNVATIARSLLGSNHPVVKDIDSMLSICTKSTDRNINVPVDKIAGTLFAIKSDMAGGHFEDMRGKIRIEVEADFLGQAHYLLEEKLKDAAAMIIGAVLEDALRQLCQRNGVPEGHAIEKMNAPLKAAGVYNLPQQQQITAWAAIRNKADHGKFSEYSLEEVRLMHQGVSGFIIKHIG